MKLTSECMSCVIKQVERAIRRLKPDSPNSLIVETQYRLMKYISDKNIASLTSEDIGTVTYKYIADALGILDPYKEEKTKFNNLALNMYPQLLDMIQYDPNPLKKAIIFSIYGNGIDFGAPVDFDLDNISEFSKFTLENEFEFEKLLYLLKHAKSILIIGDNAGEIVFDKILVNLMRKTYPSLNLTYAVRRGPIINDATMEDAIEISMTNECKVVESSQTPGILLLESSREFRDAFKNADLILSKGQGNFESLISIPTPLQSVFFLLKAKCALIARLLEVPQGTLVLQEKSDQFVSRVLE